MELSHVRSNHPYGVLYPVMLIAAIAVIVFSILGIISIAGWMPSALHASVSDARLSRDAAAVVPVSVRAGVTFECAECGMIEGIREIERSGTLSNLRVETESPSRL